MISVKVLTHNRPNELWRLMQSLNRQEFFDTAIHFDVEVIDNSSRFPLAGDLVEKLKTEFNADYFHLGADNIAAGRNAALLRARGKLLAFIDDDEVASPHWLAHLHHTLVKYQADAVFGPDYPRYEIGKINWVTRSQILDPLDPQTGVETGFIYTTANCLINLSSIQNTNLKFDLKFGVCGGSDTDFFIKLRRLQFKLVWCHEAVTEEVIPSQRLNARWIMRRAFRCGGGTAAVQYRVDRRRFAKELIKMPLALARRFIAMMATWPLLKWNPTIFANHFWTFFLLSGYAFFAITGSVLNEYRTSGGRFIRFPYRHKEMLASVAKRLGEIPRRIWGSVHLLSQPQP